MDPRHHTVTGWPGPGHPAHAARPGPELARSPGRFAAVLAGILLLLALALGARSCLTAAGPSTSTPGSASLITVTPILDTGPSP